MKLSIGAWPGCLYLLAVILLCSFSNKVNASACQKSSFVKLNDYYQRIISKYHAAERRLIKINEQMPALYSDLTDEFTAKDMARHFSQASNRRELTNQQQLIQQLSEELEEAEQLVDKAAEMGSNLKKLG